MPKKPRPDYEVLVPRIASGELTRKQAAAIAHATTGLSESSFLVWLSQQKLDLPHGNAGAASPHALVNTDPDKAAAYDRALALVLSGKSPGVEAARTCGVSYKVLMQRVAKAKQKDAAPAEAPQPSQEDVDLMNGILKDPTRFVKAIGVIRALGI